MAAVIIPLVAAILSLLSALIACLAARSAKQAHRTVQRLTKQPSPVIHMRGTVPAETARELGERLKREMAKQRPWKPL